MTGWSTIMSRSLPNSIGDVERSIGSQLTGEALCKAMEVIINRLEDDDLPAAIALLRLVDASALYQAPPLRPVTIQSTTTRLADEMDRGPCSSRSRHPMLCSPSKTALKRTQTSWPGRVDSARRPWEGRRLRSSPTLEVDAAARLGSRLVPTLRPDVHLRPGNVEDPGNTEARRAFGEDPAKENESGKVQLCKPS